jgi:hypothetical protein
VLPVDIWTQLKFLCLCQTTASEVVTVLIMSMVSMAIGTQNSEHWAVHRSHEIVGRFYVKKVGVG